MVLQPSVDAFTILQAEQIDDYTAMMEIPGFELTDVRDNAQCEFTSEQVPRACRKYGVKSVSLGARKQ